MPTFREWWRAAKRTWKILVSAGAVVVSIAAAVGVIEGFLARTDRLALSARVLYGSWVFAGVLIGLSVVAAMFLHFAGVGPGYGHAAPSVVDADEKRRARTLVEVLERYRTGLSGIMNSFQHAALPPSSVRDLNRRAHELSETARDCIRLDGDLLGPARLLRYDAPHPYVSLVTRDGWSKAQARANAYAAARKHHLDNIIEQLKARLRD